MKEKASACSVRNDGVAGRSCGAQLALGLDFNDFPIYGSQLYCEAHGDALGELSHFFDGDVGAALPGLRKMLRWPVV